MILGDMFELGDASTQEHLEVLKLLLDKNEIQCFFIGSAFYANKTVTTHFHFYETFDSFSEYLKEIKIVNSVVLIKGSRGMALERTLQFFS